MVHIDTLRRVNVFARLSDQQLSELAHICKEETYPAGTFLFREGQIADRHYILQAGKVALEMEVPLVPQGPTWVVTVEILDEPWQILGWSALVEPHIYTLSAHCLEETRVIAMDGPALKAWLDRECPAGYQVGMALSRLIADRLMETRKQLIRLLQETELARIFRPEESELLGRIHHFIRLRWLAVIGVIATALVASQVLQIGFPVMPVYMMALGIGLYNALFFWWARRLAKGEPTDMVERARRFAGLQIGIDLAALTTLLHFAGGVENPFFLFFIFHIINASLLLPKRSTYAAATLAVALFSSMALLEYLGLVPHVTLQGLLQADLYRHPLYVGGVLAAFIATIYVATYMATSIVGELRHRETQIVALKDRLQAEARELAQANARLAEASRLKTYFLSMASHDLKSPLVAIESYLRVLLGGYAGEIKPNQKEILERSSIRIRELLTLIDDLLDIGRIESGKLAQEFQTVDMAQVIAAAVEDVRTISQNKGITLDMQVGPLRPVQGAPARLQQVLANLLGNAVKFTPEGGRITVEARELREDERKEGVTAGLPPSILVSVTDTGIGISPEDLPHLFEAFYRGKGAGKPGAGLGLSIAQKIVEAHGGRIWAQSPPPGQASGSRFSFTIPITKGGQ